MSTGPIRLFYFLERIMVLPPELELNYNQAIIKIEEEKKMAFVSSIERMGIEFGIQQGESLILLDLVQHKFKTIPEKYRQKIEKGVKS